MGPHCSLANVHHLCFILSFVLKVEMNTILLASYKSLRGQWTTIIIRYRQGSYWSCPPKWWSRWNYWKWVRTNTKYRGNCRDRGGSGRKGLAHWKCSFLGMVCRQQTLQSLTKKFFEDLFFFPAIIFEIFLTTHLMINIFFCEILGFTKLQAIITNFSSYFKANSQLVYSQRKLKLSRQRISFTQQLRFLRVSACVALLVFFT